MATTAETHQAGQAALVTVVPDLVDHAWQLLDPHSIRDTLPRLIVAIEAIVKHYGAAAAAAALAAYRQQRQEAGVAGRVALRMPPTPPKDLIGSTVSNTISDLYGPVTPEIEQTVRQNLSAQTAQLVAAQSRTALIDATRTDPKAKGWARVPEPGACAFCAMLATRGAVYKTRDTAGYGAFLYHNDCHCHVEPVFNAYEPSAPIREWQGIWNSQIRPHFSGRDARVAFRQALEGRPVTGPLVKPYTQS